ncbi:MAG: hypothetical protein B6A08_02225 [Sorangiineae bacterium NIC37A_2]|jgi:hypothetical protein|nr:MAG: hypothetical protein B6A08_02225 [Sorangiineae bacterium NIC37A_2]
MVLRTGPGIGRQVGAWLTTLVASATVAGCLISPPPDFEDPSPGRPNISMGLVVPAPWQILPIERNGPGVLFTIPFEADDAGEKVIMQAWLNWGLADEQAIVQRSWEAQADLAHQISWTWNPTLAIPEGCQQLTILITHESNISDSTPIKPIDPELTGSITFWLNVDPDPGAPGTLSQCPLPSPE